MKRMDFLPLLPATAYGFCVFSAKGRVVNPKYLFDTCVIGKTQRPLRRYSSPNGWLKLDITVQFPKRNIIKKRIQAQFIFR